MTSKKEGSGYVALYNDIFKYTDLTAPVSSLDEWQKTGIDYCLDMITSNHESDVKLTRLRYGLEKDDITTGKTFKECTEETGIKNTRDKIEKVLRKMRHGLYMSIILRKGYLETYLAVKEEKEARNKRDAMIGEQISSYLEFNLFKDMRGYVNYKSDLELDKYKVSLDAKVVGFLRSSDINTFNNLVEREEDIKLGKIFGVGSGARQQETLDYIKEIKEYDKWFNNMSWKWEQLDPS